MNDLASREDGNPLSYINALKAEKEKYGPTYPPGGVQTQHLEQFNAEAKYQVEAI